MNGVPQRLLTVPPPTDDEIKKKGVLPFLDPLPRFEIPNRATCSASSNAAAASAPKSASPSGSKNRASRVPALASADWATENRTDPVMVGLARTRLLTRRSNFLGTNDHAGDYRSSGCTACHVVYANDRSPVNSGPTPSSATKGSPPATIRAFAKLNPAIRFSIASRIRSRQASASSATSIPARM